jgi:hypothetical protein
MAFQVLYTYDYIMKLCRQQAEFIQNHENADVHNIEKVKPDTGNIRGLSLVAVKHTTVQVTRQPLQHDLHELGHDLLCQALYIFSHEGMTTDRVLD